MKKTYIIPTIKRTVMLKAHMVLCASGVTSEDIGYGGVDGDGSIEPSSRQDNGWLDNDE